MQHNDKHQTSVQAAVRASVGPQASAGTEAAAERGGVGPRAPAGRATVSVTSPIVLQSPGMPVGAQTSPCAGGGSGRMGQHLQRQGLLTRSGLTHPIGWQRCGHGCSRCHARHGQRPDAAPSQPACIRSQALHCADRRSPSQGSGRIPRPSPPARSAVVVGGQREQHTPPGAAAPVGLRHGWRRCCEQRQDQASLCVLGQHLQVV